MKFYPENIFEGLWRLPSRVYTLCDLAIGGLTPTAARMKEGATFSEMSARFQQSLLVRKDDYEGGRITSYDSFLKSKAIDAIARGEIGNEHQEARDSSLITISKRDFHEGFAIAVDGANKRLLEELNHAIEHLTSAGKIGVDAWRKNPLVFKERAGTTSGARGAPKNF